MGKRAQEAGPYGAIDAARCVKPYVKRQKNDVADAEAICEVVTHTPRITADDGYAVALAFAEIDPDGNVEPIVATDCSGKSPASPQLVMPGNVHAGRAVEGIVTVEVKL